MSFHLCSLSNRPQVSDLSWPTIKDYCERHGYTFTHRNTVINTDRHPSWSKIPFLQDLVSSTVVKDPTPVVVWIDDDMMITNPVMSLDILLAPFLESPHILAVQEDTHGELFNCGLIAIKCVPSASTLLQQIWDACDAYEKRRGYWEQTTMQRLYQARQSLLKPRLFIFPPRTLQSFFRPNEDSAFQWAPGDFIAHVSGLDLPRRIDYMDQLQTYLQQARALERDAAIHRVIRPA